MSHSHYYPFWKAPLKLWLVRIGFGPFGLMLLYLFLTTIWSAATKNAFTVYKLRPATGAHTTIYYVSSPHWVYWGALIGYSTICLVTGLFFVLIAYAATFRAVIPGKEDENSRKAR